MARTKYIDTALFDERHELFLNVIKELGRFNMTTLEQRKFNGAKLNRRRLADHLRKCCADGIITIENVDSHKKFYVTKDYLENEIKFLKEVKNAYLKYYSSMTERYSYLKLCNYLLSHGENEIILKKLEEFTPRMCTTCKYFQPIKNSSLAKCLHPEKRPPRTPFVSCGAWELEPDVSKHVVDGNFVVEEYTLD